MVEVPDKYLEEAVAARAIAHGAARDDSDARKDRTTAALIDMLSNLQREVVENLKSGGRAVQELKDSLTRVEAKVEQFVKAFPDGDADGHRRAHEEDIKKAAKRDRFWQALIIAFSILVMTASVTWGVHVLWPAFLMGPK